MQRLFDWLGWLTLEDLAEVLADHHHILVDIEVLVLSTTLRRFSTLTRSAVRGYRHQNLMGPAFACANAGSG